MVPERCAPAMNATLADPGAVGWERRHARRASAPRVVEFAGEAEQAPVVGPVEPAPRAGQGVGRPPLAHSSVAGDGSSAEISPRSKGVR